MMISIHLNKNANYCHSKAVLKIIGDQIMAANLPTSPLLCPIVVCSSSISSLISRRSWDKIDQTTKAEKLEKK